DRDGGRVRARLIPVRDALLVTAALLASVYAGSGRLARFDPALGGYLGAVVVATFATAWRVSAFWRPPASRPYARAPRAALVRPRTLRQALASAGADVAAQRFIAHRGRLRWIAHLLLSGGTLAAVAITLPLVCGWLHFTAEGQDTYRAMVVGIPTVSLAVD